MIFLLFPYGADVSLYYRPWATVWLIVVNVVVFIVTGVHYGLAEPLMLQFGEGIHPTQWLTAAFMHDGIAHLVFNMMFLWPFGLIVEGKIGWWRFLVVYLGIAVCCNLVFQLAMLSATPNYALGASTAIYGLIGIAVIWTPRNELDIAYFIWIIFLLKVGTAELAIMFFGMFYIGLDLISAFLTGFEMGTPMLHLPGALLGLVVGVVMLKKGLVDCENWDIFAVWADRAGEEAPETQVATVSAEELAERTEARHRAALAHIREMIAAENPEAAMKLDDKMRRRSTEWALPADVHKQLVRKLHEQGVWEPSLPLMVDYLRRYPEGSTRMRLRLAQVLITKVERPAQGIRVLEKLPDGSLDDKLEAARRKLLRQAQILRDSGAMELRTEDW